MARSVEHVGVFERSSLGQEFLDKSIFDHGEDLERAGVCSQGAGHWTDLEVALDDTDTNAHLGEEDSLEEADRTSANDQNRNLLDGS